MKRGRPRSTRTCDVEECERAHYAAGLCRMHYRRMERHGNVTTVQTVGRKPHTLACRVEGCDIATRARGLCHKHYMSAWRKGTLEGEHER
jgi:hypothetical protein